MVISHHIVLSGGKMIRDGVPPAAPCSAPEDVYRNLGCSYPKFFKMDKLCKWAFVGAEYLLGLEDDLYAGIDRYNTSVVLATSHGCVDVDKRYLAGIDMPSPALFVYTLPNIMLGEICIRRGFKGEQLCTVSKQPDAAEFFFQVSQMIEVAGMEACLCGWVDATGDEYRVYLMWVTKDSEGRSFTPAAIQAIIETNL